MDDIQGAFTDEQEAIKLRLLEISDAAKSKDFERMASYHLHSPKFTAFRDVGPQQRIGVDETNRLEREQFQALDAFDAVLDDVQVDVFGAVAVLTTVFPYTFRSGAETGSGRTRMTLVWVQDRGDWKIVHEHHSPWIDSS